MTRPFIEHVNVTVSDPERSAALMAAIFGWLVTFPIAWTMRRHVQWKTGLLLFVGSLPGSWFGAELLKRL